jgi:disulfide oxidoreductase YuzD
MSQVAQALAQALITLDGQIGLVAQDGNFLGLICSDPNHPNSIINPNTYGNPNGNTVFNHNSDYGGLHGLHSPCNSSCLNPPILMDINDKQLALVTRNYSLVVHDLDIIDIDFMLGISYGLAYQQRSNSNEQFENIYNLRAQEIAAEQAIQLGNIYAEASRNQAQNSATTFEIAMGRRPAY